MEENDRNRNKFKAGCYALSVVCLCFMMLAAGRAGAADIKPKVAFFMFVPQNIEAMSLMDSIPSLLTMSVSKTGDFEIIERKRLEKEVELEGYKLGSIKANEMYKLGEKIGFDFGVVGDVLKQRGTITSNIKVMDVRSQRVIFEQEISTTEGGLNDRINSVAALIMDKIREACSTTTVDVKTGDTVVSPPRDLRARSGTKKIRIAWSYANMQDVCGFKVYRARAEEGPYMQLGTVTETFFTDEDPALNERLFYKVTAISKKGVEGGFSAPVEASTVAGPPPPIFLNADPDVKAAHLKWVARPGSDTKDTRIFRKEAADKDFRELTSVSEVLSYSDSGLKDDTVYYYALAAVDSKGVESDMTSALEVRTLKSPDGLKADGGKIRRVNLNWSIYPYDIEGYIIYRSADKASGYKQIARIREKTTGSYTDREGLADAFTYWYRVSAFNRNGAETDMSEAVSAVTRSAPPVPAGFAAKDREPRRVSLQWSAVNSADDEIKGYYIFRASEEKGEFRNITRISEPGATSFVDSDRALKDNTTYYYKIASYNSADVSSSMSDAVSSTTKNPPAVPKGVKAASGEVKQVSLGWDANPESDIKEYIVLRALAGERDLSRTASVKGGTAYVDTGLKDGTKYVYSIQAVDADGLYSEPCQPVTAGTKPLPARPSGLKAVDQSGKKMLQWDPNPEKDVKQYNVYKKGFLGISQKVTTVQGNSWTLPDDMKGRNELFVTALDDTSLESENSDVMEIVIEKK